MSPSSRQQQLINYLHQNLDQLARFAYPQQNDLSAAEARFAQLVDLAREDLPFVYRLITKPPDYQAATSRLFQI